MFYQECHKGQFLVPYFLVYINYLPTVCKSSQANLFADDTLLYRHTRNVWESIKQQEDLTALEDWESKLQPREMHFTENHDK